MTKTITQSLTLEHDSIIEVEKDDECYTPPYGDERTNYIERHYVTEFTPRIFENLRFFTRKKGRRAGHLTPIYVNPKTGKGMKNPVEAYMREVEKALPNTISLVRRIDVQVVQHLREHIKAKIVKNQRDTVSRLRREKEKLRQ